VTMTRLPLSCRSMWAIVPDTIVTERLHAV
jgi:hypothetical protein